MDEETWSLQRAKHAKVLADALEASNRLRDVLEQADRMLAGLSGRLQSMRLLFERERQLRLQLDDPGPCTLCEDCALRVGHSAPCALSPG
jgi:predicted metal-binding protein